MKYASIGSISEATLRTQDLLEAFADTLQSLCDDNPDHESHDTHQSLVSQAYSILDECEDLDENDDAIWLVNEDLPDALNEHAAPYCYFGTHIGDGACFGFWVSQDAIEELASYADYDDRDHDHIVVNDHGNVAYIDATGAMIWACV